MKYIDADRLRAEIERRQKSLRAGICNEEVFTKKQRNEMLVASEELDRLSRFLSTLESEKTISPWKKIHTYTEELHKGDMEKMLLELSVGKGEKRTKVALPDRIVDILESEKPMNPDGLEKDVEHWFFNEISSKINVEHSMYYYFQECARRYAQWGAEHLKK